MNHSNIEKLIKYLYICTVTIFIFSPIISNAQQTSNIKIFQIGSSRCGTNTLTDFFNANGIYSIHHDDGKLAETMYNNYTNNKPILEGQYEDFIGYFDMMNITTFPPIYGPQIFFKELDKQYPGSKFILNTRNRADLLKSISVFKVNGVPYLDICASYNKISKQNVLDMWSKALDDHYNSVLDYFKHRPADLLIFNIDIDPPEKISEFFKDYFTLNTYYYIHKNKTEQ